MATVERITITLPNGLVQDMDRLEKNRSKFVAEAVRAELDRRRREELRRSLRNVHAETAELADPGLAEWSRGLPEDADALIGRSAGKAIRWVPGEGWTEEKR